MKRNEKRFVIDLDSSKITFPRTGKNRLHKKLEFDSNTNHYRVNLKELKRNVSYLFGVDQFHNEGISLSFHFFSYGRYFPNKVIIGEYEQKEVKTGYEFWIKSFHTYHFKFFIKSFQVIASSSEFLSDSVIIYFGSIEGNCSFKGEEERNVILENVVYITREKNNKYHLLEKK